jgi:sulfite exporter TauE/SafE
MNKAQATPPESSAENALQTIFQRVLWVLGGLVALFTLGLVVALGLGIAFGENAAVADIVAIVRDLFLILLALQGLLITLALVVLILQLARLLVVLEEEIKPIAKTVQETSDTVKGTAQFISETVTEPLIESRAWLSGLGAFASLLRRGRPKAEPNKEGET